MAGEGEGGGNKLMHWGIGDSFGIQFIQSSRASLCLSLCLSVSVFVSLFLCLLVSLSLSVCVSVCLSVSLTGVVGVGYNLPTV